MTVSSVCSVPRWPRPPRNTTASSKPGSSNPIVKVRTGPALAAFISAATVEESMPPDGKAPDRYVGNHAAAHGVAQQCVELVRQLTVACNGLARPACAMAWAFQKRSIFGSPFHGSVRIVPA